jgi:hypothetical protein
MGKLSPLRRRMIEDMRVRNLSPATQEAYVRAVEKLSRHFGRSPDRLNLEDVRAFQVHLAAQGYAWSTVNQTVCALHFFYGVTLGRERMPKHLAYAHEPSKLPVVLSASEVARFLAAVRLAIEGDHGCEKCVRIVLIEMREERSVAPPSTMRQHRDDTTHGKCDRSTPAKVSLGQSAIARFSPTAEK